MRTTLVQSLALIGLAACAGGGIPDDKAAPNPPATSNRLTLAAGTRIDAVTQRTISSRTDKAGETFSATVSSDVKDARGRVVIPAGSTIDLTITELQPANERSKADGKITIVVNSVTVGDRSYPITAEITEMTHTLKGRGVGATEVEKTAAGAVLGGIVGRVAGGNAKGTVIGAAVGGAVGAIVASETANRDVVVIAGTTMVVTLDGPVTVAAR